MTFRQLTFALGVDDDDDDDKDGDEKCKLFKYVHSFFKVHAKSVVVPSFEGQNWPIFYKISIYVITCAKLHKYGLNGGWDLWC